MYGIAINVIRQHYCTYTTIVQHIEFTLDPLGIIIIIINILIIIDFGSSTLSSGHINVAEIGGRQFTQTPNSPYLQKQ
jgi:hypothetical protein